MVAGGQESMSRIPFYMMREPLKYGGNTLHVSVLLMNFIFDLLQFL